MCKRCTRHTHFKKDCLYQHQEKVNFTKNTKSYELFYSAYFTNLEAKDIWFLLGAQII